MKPANLLLAEDDTVRVTDFGIARAADQDTLTAAGTVLGSAGYMSPEQTRGEPSTAASDRYALACVAFELLTRRRPFERESQAAEAAAHATEPPPSPREIDPNLPVAVDDVLARGLAKQPEDRFASGAELVSALRTALADAQTAPTTVMGPPSLPSRRSRVMPRGHGARRCCSPPSRCSSPVRGSRRRCPATTAPAAPPSS